MTLRIGTYVGLDGSGEPTVVGTAYDLSIFDLSVPLGDNEKISKLRDGRTRLVYDPKPVYEVSGNITILLNDIDKKSLITYLGSYRYFANNIYHHRKYHLPVVLFLRGINDHPNKAYVCYLLAIDPIITAQAMEDDTEMMHFSRMNSQKTWSIDFHVTMTGSWSTFGDVASASWEDRS